MKWVLIGLAVIVGLIVLVTIIGAMLPKGHVATRTIRLRQKPATIWEVITNFEAAPSWRTDLTKVERAANQNGHPVWVEIGKNGRMPLEIEVFEPPRRMVTRIADPNLPFGGTWTFEIAEAGGGGTVAITERGEVYNPIFRFISRVFMDPASTIESYQKALAKKFGEATAFV